jgi:hypothetical protein
VQVTAVVRPRRYQPVNPGWGDTSSEESAWGRRDRATRAGRGERERVRGLGRSAEDEPQLLGIGVPEELPEGAPLDHTGTTGGC